jgi:hypothetical protein
VEVEAGISAPVEVEAVPADAAVAPRPACARAEVLDRLNAVLRRPDRLGGEAEAARLLDLLAARETPAGPAVWIVDTNARLAPSELMRTAFPDPGICVAASQYGQDAHRRGWLRLDRALTSAAYEDVVRTAKAWAGADRSVSDTLAAYGPPSVVFGSPDPGLPKTFGYATENRATPLLAFHFGVRSSNAAGPGPAEALLLGVRLSDNFLSGWELTPFGEERFV